MATLELTAQIFPPGPEEPHDLGFTDDVLERIVQWFNAYGNVYKVYSPARKQLTYVLSDPEHVKHVMLTNNKNYTKGVGIDRVKILLGNGIMVSEGDYWRKQRRMIQPSFHRDVIMRLSHLMKEENKRLLSRWSVAADKKERINITEEMSDITLNIVLHAIFSVDLIKWEEEKGANPFALVKEETTRDLAFAARFRNLGKVIAEIANNRKKEGRIEFDFLSMLMEAKDKDTGKPMSERELLDEVMTLIVAGHETTASALNWAWYFISQHPEVESQLVKEANTVTSDLPGFEDLADLPYHKQVIEETMRLYPPGWLLTRRSIKEDKIGEYYVPPKTDIFISPYVIHRHPALWSRPHEFDPGRFDPSQKERSRFEYFPFAGGPRQCIGDFFALVEMQLHLSAAIRQFKMEYMDTNEIEVEPQINLRTKHPIYMLPHKRR